MTRRTAIVLSLTALAGKSVAQNKDPDSENPYLFNGVAHWISIELGPMAITELQVKKDNQTIIITADEIWKALKETK